MNVFKFIKGVKAYLVLIKVNLDTKERLYRKY